MMPDTAAREFAYAYGRPEYTATYKAQPEDFRVTEELGFEPDGAGEHLFLLIEKTGLSTQEVHEKLIRFFRRPGRDIGYAGMKDRQAVTQQWFSVRLPDKTDNYDELQSSRLRVCRSVRNSRKLKRGSHRRNFFDIRLRAIDASPEKLAARLDAITTSGFPNYFGEQRFGRFEDNVQLARELFAGGQSGKPVSRYRRGVYLSAARAAIFNYFLSRRVAADNWNRYLSGDVMMLDGTNSTFVTEAWTDELQERLARQDIHPTGPLWGRAGKSTNDRAKSRGDCAGLEAEVIAEEPELAAGLEKAGLELDRRAMRSMPSGLSYSMEDASTLRLSFSLNRGAYATSLLRELVNLRPLALTGRAEQNSRETF